MTLCGGPRDSISNLCTKMGREDWYRNREWTPEIEAAFRTRLERSRYHRPSNLRIQALYLINTRERRLVEVGLSLAEEFINRYPDHSDIQGGFALRAEALILLGREEGVVAAFRESLRRQRPNVLTDVAFDYFLYVAKRKLRDLYAEAGELAAARARQSFDLPSHVFKFCCATALVNDDLGVKEMASKFARSALDAFNAKHSGMSKHPKMGLVHSVDANMYLDIERIARLS